MRLTGDFFHIVSTEVLADGFACRVHLRAEHPIYRVHFPGNPVTPGACLMQMATELLEAQQGRPLRLHRAVNIRFKKTIGNEAELTFRFSKVGPDGDELRAAVSIDEEGYGQCVKMSLRFKEV